MTTPSIQAVRGMNDILPDAAVAWDHVEATLVDCLRRYGYRPIRMPLVERTELFVRSIGEATDIVEKETYTFTDRNGDSLTLRPEGTASCVRAVLEHNLLYAGPQRLYYTGAMFRHERPQKGRYRQFHQVGVEALGFEGPDVDAELIVMCARMWRELGLSDVALELNTLGDPQARARYRTRLVAYLEEHHGELDDDSRRRLHTNPLRVLDSKNPALQALIANAPRMLDDLDEPSLLHFERLQALLRAAGVPFTLNPRLVRGLDYYNRTVFEWVTSRLGAQAAVCAGGRYDGLVQELGGKPAPACGFALGVERLIELLQVEGVQLPVAVPDIYVVHQGEAAAQWAWSTCERLRSRGLAVVLHCGGGNFKAQLRKADASGARYALVIGDDEAQARKVSLKPLREAGAQMLVDIDQVPDLVQAALGGNAAAGRAPEPGE